MCTRLYFEDSSVGDGIGYFFLPEAMNEESFKAASEFVSSTYLAQAQASRNSVSNRIQNLITQRRIPDEGWSAEAIELFIREVSLWDSNNFPSKAAIGEREGRCISPIVSNRHWGLIHGIGRSGDVSAEQPKAAGSSFLLSLTRSLVRDVIKNICGIPNLPKELVVLPIATGMGIMMGMTAVSQIHVSGGDRTMKRRNVIWSRIDQKSCIKAMTSNPYLQVHVVEQIRHADGPLVTDVTRISELISQLGTDTIHSVVVTTSTFSPRSPDDIPAVSKICKNLEIPLIVNNAYGLQCSKCCHLISESLRTGRIDLVVQSTDKNFLVPVGGSILFGPLADRVNTIYPGRASISPILDLLITLLQVGRNGLTELLQKRRENFDYLKQQLEVKLPKSKAQLLVNNNNNISLAIQLHGIVTEQLGSELFLRNVSGARVFIRHDTSKQMDPNIASLKNFGAHTSEPFVDKYLNAACAIGTTRDEIDLFIRRLIDRLGGQI